MKTNAAIAVAGVLGLAGCASITQGTSQVISFSIEPLEAKCEVIGKGGSSLGVVTGRSNFLQVSKGTADLVVNCLAEGYKPSATRIVSSTQTAGVLGIAIDLGITDMLTGAMWKYPDHITIAMEKETPAVTSSK